MNQYNEISTLQYMGSKARIISHICDPIMKNKSIQTVVDLFAGTGSVGYALKSYKNVISNDIEYYAYIINQAILNGCNFSELEETSFWAVVCFLLNMALKAKNMTMLSLLSAKVGIYISLKPMHR